MGWKATALPLLPRDQALMPWPQMCHFPARGQKSKETKFLELCCKENNSSEKDWSHIFRLDTVVGEMSEVKTFLFTFLTCPSSLLRWVLGDICTIPRSGGCRKLSTPQHGTGLRPAFSVYRVQTDPPDSSQRRYCMNYFN